MSSSIFAEPEQVLGQTPNADLAAAGRLKVGFPMWLLDEQTPRCSHEDRDRDRTLSLTDRKVPFLLLYQTLTKLGHLPGAWRPEESDLSFAWTGKHVAEADRTRSIVMEVAWLPRWHYQISPTGSNCLGHYARDYEFTPLDRETDVEIRAHLATMRRVFERTVNPGNVRRLEQALPREFVLFPLQLANDFNLKFSGTEFSRFYSPSADASLELARACMDRAAAVSASIPIVFRQHPFDTTADFRDRLHTNQKLIDNTDRVTCHDIFATGRCRAVISVNSNTVHEAAAWNIPSICLGTLIWSERISVRPYASSIDDLDTVMKLPPQDDEKLLAYLHYLLRQQWTLSDFQNSLMVDALVSSLGRCEPAGLRRRLGCGL